MTASPSSRPLSPQHPHTDASSAVSDAQVWETWCLSPEARRLVVRMARRYARLGLLDEDDLQQAGYIGLFRAASRFEPRRGIHYLTCARWWVRAEMIRAMDRGSCRPVRLPGSVRDLLFQLEHLRRDEGWQGAPTPAQRANAIRMLRVSARRLEELLQISRWNVLGLPEAVEAAPRCLLDDNAPTEETLVGELDALPLQGRLLDALCTLDEQAPREAMLVRAVHGLPPYTAQHTYAALGRQLGLSRERVRQMTQQGVALLRARLAEPEP